MQQQNNMQRRYMNRENTERILRHLNVGWILAAITLSAALGIVLTGCTADTGRQPAAGGDGWAPLTVTTAIAPADGQATIDTRTAADGAPQNDAFEANQTLRLYFSGGNVRQRGSDEEVTSAEMTTGAGGTVATTTKMNGAAPIAEARPYLAPGEEHVWVDAFYPPQDGAGASVGNEMTTFTVAQNQHSADDYRRSDLMYASATAVRGVPGTTAYAPATAALIFRHKMAKIIVKVRTADTSAALNIKAVRMVRGYRSISFDSEADSRACRLGSVLGTPVTGAASGWITLYEDATGTTDLTAAGVCCLVPPQRIAAGDLLLVETARGSVSYKLATDQTLREGCVYTATLGDISDYQLGQSVTIDAWSLNGSATVQSRPASMPFYVNGVLLNMIFVEGGAYTDTRGTHTFTGTLTDYYVAETEVTNALYKAAVGTLPPWYDTAASGYTIKTGSPDRTGDLYPVQGLFAKNCLEAYGATPALVDALNTATESQRPKGWRFDITSVAQWYYAACGGKYTHHYNYAGSDSQGTVAAGPVTDGPNLPATKAANELGLYDMTGNMWENCKDRYTDMAGYAAADGDLGADYVATGGAYTQPKGGSGNGDPNSSWYSSSASTWTYEVNDKMKSAAYHNSARLTLVKNWPLADAKVGDLVGSDGVAYAHTSQMPQGVEPVAMVASRTVSATDAAAGYTGYAMALRCPTRALWMQRDPGEVITDQVNYTTNGNCTTMHDALDGRTNSPKVAAWCAARGLDMAREFPAFQVLAEYGARVAAAPRGTSGWFMPSIGQAMQWVENLGGMAMKTGGTYNAGWYSTYFGAASAAITAMNAKMTAAGLTAAQYTPFAYSAQYHTTTVTTSARPWMLWFESYDNGNGQVYYWNSNHLGNFNEQAYVRPVLAF